MKGPLLRNDDDTVTIAPGTQGDHAVTLDQLNAAAPMRFASIAVSSAEILNMFSSPKTILAAPGAGKVIVPVSIMFEYAYGSATYSLAGQGLLKSGTAILSLVTNALTSVTAIKSLLSMTNASLQENQAVTLTASGSNPTVGDGAVVIHIWYIVANI